MGWDKIADVFANVTGWFTPEQRVRRMRDELDKLQGERNLLLVSKADMARAKRMDYLNKRIEELKKLLTNSAIG